LSTPRLGAGVSGGVFPVCRPCKATLLSFVVFGLHFSAGRRTLGLRGLKNAICRAASLTAVLFFVNVDRIMRLADLCVMACGGHRFAVSIFHYGVGLCGTWTVRRPLLAMTV
jgi:hypothetical protein